MRGVPIITAAMASSVISPVPLPASSPRPAAGGPAQRWDILCRVIDNFGDIGVCWRLAAQLGARGHAVRLWTDDASALAWMAPSGAPGVRVLPWPADHDAPADGPGDVVVEAFGCETPPGFAAAMAGRARTHGRAPLWLNLEYLSAEGYVERCHGLPSPVGSGAGAGLTRWFFYPGFTPRTGGLLREDDLAARQAAFDRAGWRAARGVAPHALAVSLFCYEPPALANLVQQLRDGPRPAHLLATPGRAAAALAALHPGVLDLLPLPAGGEGGGEGVATGTRPALDQPPHPGPLPRAGEGERPQKAPIASQNGPQPLNGKGWQLSISCLPHCPQPRFDELLWACDLNFVRGEDSLVRALWAGQPCVWQIYPQHDDAHHAKLHAFLDWLDAPASLRRAHLAWNGLAAPRELPLLAAATLADWRACIQAARDRLMRQPDLLTQLLGFAGQKS
ncbi:conserved hypothetical protein, PP_1857 family [Oryzisolibacter propanilivorax]|uniref:Protein-arginine rhamnosyltransferase n=2 Tax=Oryzisolibacter propanilivorax TaxID=1527607 RepID=A0A1G9P238_9BURK|nr:conserved hypothetical protein, PP_1857 family [Oryzisolibacter propanilivorax]